MTFVFIRTPVTGDVTVWRVLRQKNTWSATDSGIAAFLAADPQPAVMLCEPDVGRRFYDGSEPAVREQYTWVGFLRHPYERFIASWRFCVQKGWIPKDTNPVSLLQKASEVPMRVWQHVHLQQIFSLYAANGSRIPSLLIRTEQLAEDFNRVYSRMGFQGDANTTFRMVNKKTTPIEDWRSYYDEYPELKQAVETAFPADIATLPYVFDTDLTIGSLPTQLKWSVA